MVLILLTVNYMQQVPLTEDDQRYISIAATYWHKYHAELAEITRLEREIYRDKEKARSQNDLIKRISKRKNRISIHISKAEYYKNRALEHLFTVSFISEMWDDESNYID